ncbi:hypothetical protein [Pantanalinema sp. GBBB05]
MIRKEIHSLMVDVLSGVFRQNLIWAIEQFRLQTIWLNQQRLRQSQR